MFAPSVAPAERRPAAPREEIDGKGGGEKAIKTGRRRRREREEDYHLKRGKGRLRREETNQTLIQRGSGNRRRRWRRRPTIFCIGYVAAMATGCSRRCRRRRRRASLPMKDMRLARRRYYHSLAAAAAGCRTSLGPRSSAAAGRSVRWPRNQIEEGERPTERPSSSLRLTAPAPGDSGYDFLTAAAPVGGGQHEVRTDGGAGHPRRHSARAHASLLCRIISR